MTDNKSKQLQCLPLNTARLLSSGQIITSVSSVVKELVENALDAGAANISVKLDNFGLDVIEVKDDGHGISYDNVHKMFLPGYTSKIDCFKDLDSLNTYGFRGEALAAIVKLAEVTVTTISAADSLAMAYTISSTGSPTSSAPHSLQKGAIITARNLFKSLPVRKQFVSSKKRMADELKKVEGVVQSLAIIHPQVRVVLTHNKSVIWQKNKVQTLKQSYMQLIGLRNASKMHLLENSLANVKLEMLVPNKDAADAESLFSSSAAAASYVYLNRRPVSYREFSKIINEAGNSHWRTIDKHVLHLLSLTVPPDQIDVNLEPNKTKVFLRNFSQVQQLLISTLQNYYGCKLSQSLAEQEAEEVDDEMPAKRTKYSAMDDEDDEVLSQMDESLGEDFIPAKTLSSRLNKESCTLATSSELAILRDKLQDNGRKLVTLTSSQENIYFEPNHENQNNLTKTALTEPVNGDGSYFKDGLVENNFGNFNGLREIIDDADNEYQLMFAKKGAEDIVMSSKDVADVSKLVDEGLSDEISTQELFDRVRTTMANSSKRPELAIADWSRGKVRNTDGTVLQPGAVLVTGNVERPPIDIQKKQTVLGANVENVCQSSREANKSLNINKSTPVKDQWNNSIGRGSNQELNKSSESNFDIELSLAEKLNEMEEYRSAVVTRNSISESNSLLNSFKMAASSDFGNSSPLSNYVENKAGSDATMQSTSLLENCAENRLIIDDSRETSQHFYNSTTIADDSSNNQSRVLGANALHSRLNLGSVNDNDGYRCTESSENGRENSYNVDLPHKRDDRAPEARLTDSVEYIITAGGSFSQNPFRSPMKDDPHQTSVSEASFSQNPFRRSTSPDKVKESSFPPQLKTLTENSLELDADVALFDLSRQSACSQLGRKEHTAFTKFSGIERPKIIKENPGIIFTEVSKMLMERWRQLDDEGRRHYQAVARAVDDGRRAHKQTKAQQPPVAAPETKRKEKMPGGSLHRPPRKEIQFAVSLEKVVAHQKIKLKSDAAASEIIPVVIGRIEEDFVALVNRQIGFIRLRCLSESENVKPGDDKSWTKMMESLLRSQQFKTESVCSHGRPHFFPFHSLQ